ncbi:UDP-N-acetylmuramoyl-L-alanine--D-glutamate ligase [Terricaulis silvestris]|uniref:UDP-N-acetylmuramoylalanine--D-glutamate ligase n=1 Tax=Terricaulis silvestris TaxID=2686094 RepID=A0A6I6MU02_9CAUL|nr:UDP-N-acetylmuramoyl-L-alanine--D-glutamate ligase [Terricaulis silvestris]QGZ95974.1 UDP-N-acetylmuramoylalanine--D-glutamate ligase [Terricaulis silvestris]
MIPITEFKGRDVAVFGLARTGLAAARALTAGGARVHAWDDNDVSRAAAEAAGVPVSDINARDWRSFAALVLSPGVPLTFPEPHRVVTLAEAVGVPIIGDIELFARAVNALPATQRPKLIGITGTNGKSTTSALIAHILSEAGKDTRLGGNIGAAILEQPPLHAGAYYVIELSSYQLDLTSSLRLDVAVYLNTTPDHLDRHGDMTNYVAAKKRIFLNQGAADWAVIGVDDPHCARICTELTRNAAQHVAPISAGQALGRGVSALGGKIIDGLSGRSEIVADLTQAPALAGKHNAQNAAAAYAATRALGVDHRIIAQAFNSFAGLPHRLERAGTIEGVRFVNDSKATNANAAAQALAVFPRVYWVAGGVAKEGGIEDLAEFYPRMAKAYLIGQSAGDFADVLRNKVPVVMAGNLEAAVKLAFNDAKASGEPHPVVLLSPACASFDQFKSYEDRGDQFKTFVAALNEAPKANGAKAGAKK